MQQIKLNTEAGINRINSKTKRQKGNEQSAYQKNQNKHITIQMLFTQSENDKQKKTQKSEKKNVFG